MIKLYFTLFFTLSLSSCFSNSKTSPSYVIVAIDRLAAGTVSCPEYLEKAEGGFFILCNDFIRLANAYTTSLQSPAAIGSLLTGEYPINHGLRHADSFLSFNHQLISQNLVKQGYKTAFFSEGDPVKSYQGLNRGFETFYDYSITSDDLSTNEVFQVAEKFILKTQTPQFSIIYLSALRNPKNSDPKINLIEDQLEQLFTKLKAKNKWHNTHILIVGLQGKLAQSYKNPWPIIDLSEDNIKVDAFIKPATKPRDKELSFQVDENISLADIGRTLLAWSSSSINPVRRNMHEVTFAKSLLRFLSTQKNIENTKAGNRNFKNPFLVESSWSDWRFGMAPIYLILDDQYRVFINKNLKVYNVLMNQEISQNIEEQIPEERLSFYKNVSTKLNSEGLDQFKKPEIDKFILGYQIWGLGDYKYPEIFQDLEIVNQNEDSTGEIVGWMAKLAVMNSDCKMLMKISKIKNNTKWKLAASSCLSQNIKFTNQYRNGCLRVFFKHLKTWSNQCQNDLLYHAWKYLNFDKTETQLNHLKNLLIINDLKDRRSKNNWKTYLSSSLAYEIAIEPTDFELYYLQLSQDQKMLIDQAMPQL